MMDGELLENVESARSSESPVEVNTNAAEEGGTMAPEDTDDLQGCRRECMKHPEATAFQFNEPDDDDGFCACLTLEDGVKFDDAIEGEFIHPDAHDCTCLPSL